MSLVRIFRSFAMTIIIFSITAFAMAVSAVINNGLDNVETAIKLWLLGTIMVIISLVLDLISDVIEYIKIRNN